MATKTVTKATPKAPAPSKFKPLEPQQKLDKVMALLPQSAAGIARYLEAEGIRGQPEMAHYCPIARFLERYFGRDYFAQVLSERSIMVGGKKTGLTGAFWYGTNRGIDPFMANFDNGKYPRLIER